MGERPSAVANAAIAGAEGRLPAEDDPNSTKSLSSPRHSSLLSLEILPEGRGLRGGGLRGRPAVSGVACPEGNRQWIAVTSVSTPIHPGLGQAPARQAMFFRPPTIRSAAPLPFWMQLGTRTRPGISADVRPGGVLDLPGTIEEAAVAHLVLGNRPGQRRTELPGGLAGRLNGPLSSPIRWRECGPRPSGDLGSVLRGEGGRAVWPSGARPGRAPEGRGTERAQSLFRGAGIQSRPGDGHVRRRQPRRGWPRAA